MLIGRSAERSQLSGLLDASRAGAGKAVVLAGEPGIGKTALLEAFLADADGVRTLHARGTERESTLAFAGLSELFAPVMAFSERLPHRQRAALHVALGLDHGTTSDRLSVYAATVGLLSECSAQQPVLAIVDDLQWLDLPSREALEFSARRLSEDRVCLIFGRRDDESARVPGCAQMRIAGLSRAEALSLLDHRTGTPVAPTVAERLHAATGGNPLALVELSRLLTPSQLMGGDPLPDPLPAGPDVLAAFGRRLTDLPPTTQEALTVAAAAGTCQPATLLAALSARGLAMQALDAAEAAEVITLAGGRLTFAHPLMRAAAYHRAPADRRRSAHKAIAIALNGASAGRRALHLAAATVIPEESVAQELENSAADALRRAAPAVAAVTLETAAALSPDPAASEQRFLRAANAHFVAGARAATMRVLDHALALTDDPLVRADAQRLRAHAQALTGRLNPTRELLTAEAERVRPFDQARAMAMLVDAAMVSLTMGWPRQALEQAERAAAIARPLSDSLHAYANVAASSTGILCGSVSEHYPRLERWAPIAMAQNATLGPVATLVVYGELWVGHHQRAHELAQTLVERLRAEASLAGLGYALTALAHVEYFLGAWRDLATHTAEAIELCEALGDRVILTQPMLIGAMVAGGQGHFDDARDQTRRASRLSEELEIGSTTTHRGYVQGLVELAAGDYAAAIEVLEPTGRFTLERGVHGPSVFLWAQDLCEAYVRLGRRADAEATLRELDQRLTDAHNALAAASAARCHGLLAADNAFEPHFERALALHGDPNASCPFETARTFLCLGERRRRARRRTAAREPLRRAIEIFDSLGATPWSDKARAELRATGERVRHRQVDKRNDLTPHELRVAKLVADGATNREAAAALFVSPRTIETHLQRAFRKLGVRSRTELARELRRVDGVVSGGTE